jgi:integrase
MSIKSKNHPSSILEQVTTALKTVVMNDDEQKAYKVEYQVDSVKKDLRPNGRPNRSLPVILGKRTFSGYLETCTKFFERARELTGKKMLAELFTAEIVLDTLDTFYSEMAPATLRTLLSALNMLHQACRRRKWVKGRSPINGTLRQHVREYRDDGDVRAPRFGYLPEDAPRIIECLKASGSAFVLPAEVVLRCGLRLSEVAGMRGSDVDKTGGLLRVKGKGGKVRHVELPADLAEQLNESKEFLFTPNQTWKSKFYQAMRKATRNLGIKVSGIHRLRSNYAQDKYTKLRAKGLTDRQARQKIAHEMGHNRIDVTKGYIPSHL